MTLRVRKLDALNDKTFGHQQSDFYIDEPRAVAQIALTRLMLYFGEWFLDNQDGTKWFESVLGYNTTSTRDLEIQSRVLGTPNLTEITNYSSSFEGDTRVFRVAMRVDTSFGPTNLGFVADTATGSTQFILGE